MRGGWRDQADGALGLEGGPGGSRAGQRGLWQSRWPREARRLWKVAMSQANKEENTTFGSSLLCPLITLDGLKMPFDNSPISELRVKRVQRQLDGGDWEPLSRVPRPQEWGHASGLRPSPLPICVWTELGSQDPHPIPLLRETPPPLQSGTVFSGSQ